MQMRISLLAVERNIQFSDFIWFQPSYSNSVMRA